MSEERQQRIAILQHKRRQGEAREALSRISDELGELYHAALDEAISWQLQSRLFAKVKEMRARGALTRSEFATAGEALEAIRERVHLLGPGAIFQVHTGAQASGFFFGPPSREFLKSCLLHRYESASVVLPGLEAGALLDVVLGDPLKGDFYEVEWWHCQPLESKGVGRSMATDTLTWLQQWYLSRCDGEWEHEKGVRIDTLDNPGWSVEVEVGDVPVPPALALERGDGDWIRCEINNGQFRGYGGPGNLQEILEVLREWVRASD